MSYLRRVHAALANRPGEKLFGHQVAALAGITTRTFQRHASKMVADNRISRVKVKGSSISYYRYYLSDEQEQICRSGVGRFPDSFAMITDTDDLPGRLKFLRMLKEKTVFGEHVTLALIIDDYERTLKLRRQHADTD